MTDTDKESLLRQINDTRRHRAALQRLVDTCMISRPIVEGPVCDKCFKPCGSWDGSEAHDDGCPWKDALRVLERPTE